MVSFYSHVFRIQFSPSELAGFTLYEGDWNGLELQLCPAELAQNTARQNRHQLNVEVEDLELIIQNVKENGGKLMGNISEEGSVRSIGIYDLDQNSLVLRENKI